MFTKKTRVLSALLTVCMVISLLACFVVPAVAQEGLTTSYAGELVSTVGMTDTTDIPSIQNYSSASGTYKVASRADLEKLSQVVQTGSFTGKIVQAADIDLGWKNWTGIQGVFKGTYDGNGFVIENMLIVSPPYSRSRLLPRY